MSRIAIIERCGQCEHFADSSAGTYCMFRHQAVTWKQAPPGWCPLTKADEVARVKPLGWDQRSNGLQGYALNCSYSVDTDANGNAWWHWDGPEDSEGFTAGGSWKCESLEAGKAACEAHYRAALFGDNGPLVQIGDGETSAPTRKIKKQTHNQGKKRHSGGSE